MTDRSSTKALGTVSVGVGVGIIAASMLLMALDTQVDAAQRGGGPRGGRMHADNGGPALGRILPPLRRLDLDEFQRTQVRALMDQHREAFRTTAEQLRAARRALRGAVTTDVVNEGAIRSHAAQLATLEGDAAVQQASLFAQVWQLLTPDQQAQAAELEEAAQARRSERRTRMEERRQKRQERRPDA